MATCMGNEETTNVFVLYGDQTFEELPNIAYDGVRLKIKNPSGLRKLLGDKESWNPEARAGRGIFTERSQKKHWWQFWRKKSDRKIAVIDYLGERALELDPETGKIHPDWQKKDAQKIIAKEIAHAHSEQKPFSNWQLIPLILLHIITLALLIWTNMKIGG